MQHRLRLAVWIVALLLLDCADDDAPGGAGPDVGDVGASEDTGDVDLDTSEFDGADAPSWDMPADRSILGFTGETASAANQAALPEDWTEIEPTRCAEDTTRQFIGELVTHGIENPQVHYHWAPVVPGPSALRPVQGMFDFYLAGDVVGVAESGDDVRADHPFGFDFTWDVVPDPEFAYMSNDEDRGGGGERERGVHSEIEMPVFPRDRFGFDPVAGDRSLQRGAWVLDCGHPPYGAELHPPTFLAFARATTADVTDSVALANPYRIAQLFAPTLDYVVSFDDDSRFDFASVKPFPDFFVAAVLSAFTNGADRLEGHMLMEALRFDRIEWDVCAPLPRPEGASLAATWRFTARTGVTIQADADDANGCVHLIAEMDDRYAPAPLVPSVVDWPWDELNESASAQLGEPIDVRQTLVDIAESLGFPEASIPALDVDHPPVVDQYDPLLPREGAEAAAPTAIIEGADDQPFPFYGHVHAAWE